MPDRSTLWPLVIGASLLGSTLAAQGDVRFGKLRINAPGTWYLTCYDKVGVEGNKVVGYDGFPFYNNPDAKDQSVNNNRLKVLPEAKGSLFIRATQGDGKDRLELKDRSQVVPLEGLKDYTLEFPYGTIGLKDFKHVLNLYSSTQTSCLVSLTSKATGSDLIAKLEAQADYDASLGKFKPKGTDAYQVIVNTGLGGTDGPKVPYLVLVNPLRRDATQNLALALVNNSKVPLYFYLTQFTPTDLLGDLTVLTAGQPAKATTQGLLAPNATCEVGLPGSYTTRTFSFLIMVCDGKDVKTFKDMKHINLFQVTGAPNRFLGLASYTSAKAGATASAIPPFDNLQLVPDASTDPAYPKLMISDRP